MPDISVQRTILAESTAVWELVSDPIRYGEWSPENQGARWLGGAAKAAVGARFRGKNKHGWAIWSTTCTITECTENERFTFAVTSGPIKVSTWGYLLEPGSEPGTTLVTEHSTNHEAKWLERLGSRVIRLEDRGEYNRTSIEATLAAMAAELES